MTHDQYTRALATLTGRKIAPLLTARDWATLADVAELALGDAPIELARTDRNLFIRWREAVTWYHQAGWSRLNPEHLRSLASKK